MIKKYKILDGWDWEFNDDSYNFKPGDIISECDLDEVKDLLRFEYDYNKESDFDILDKYLEEVE